MSTNCDEMIIEVKDILIDHTNVTFIRQHRSLGESYLITHARPSKTVANSDEA